MDPIPFAVLQLVGLVFLFYPVVAKVTSHVQQRRRSGRAWGVIEGHEAQTSHSHDSHDRRTLHPIVVFEAEGKVHRVVSKTGASFEILNEGERVEVAYNPLKPRDAHIIHEGLAAVETVLMFLLPVVGIVILVASCHARSGG
jgi:hypothetical protein